MLYEVITIGHLRDNAGRAERRFPVHASDTDRICHDVCRLALGRFRIIVKSILREVEYDAAPRSRRQNEACRQNDFGARSWHPDVHIGICMNDVVIAKSVSAGDVDERVFLSLV